MYTNKAINFKPLQQSALVGAVCLPFDGGVSLRKEKISYKNTYTVNRPSALQKL